MSCSQCFTAQVPECIDNLFIYAKIPGDNHTDIVIKITDSHGNIYLIDGVYLDGIVSVEFTNELLPKNLLNRYAGAMTIELLYDLYMNVIQTMTICGKEYTCITLDVINNNLSLRDYYIGCAS